jgi:hypothetical protein
MHSVMELGELQWRLLVTDSKAAAHRAVLPAILLIVALCIAAGVACAFLISGAEALVAYIDLTRPAAYLAAAIVGAAVAGLLVLISVSRFRHGTDELRQSFHELSDNVACIKQTLSASNWREEPAER